MDLFRQFRCFSQLLYLPREDADILQLPRDEFKRITKINLKAPWFLLKSVATRMKEHGSGGSIVFMATIASEARVLYPGADAYATASAAIHQLVRFQASAISLPDLKRAASGR